MNAVINSNEALDYRAGPIEHVWISACTVVYAPCQERKRVGYALFCLFCFRFLADRHVRLTHFVYLCRACEFVPAAGARAGLSWICMMVFVCSGACSAGRKCWMEDGLLWGYCVGLVGECWIVLIVGECCFCLSAGVDWGLEIGLLSAGIRWIMCGVYGVREEGWEIARWNLGNSAYAMYRSIRNYLYGSPSDRTRCVSTCARYANVLRWFRQF